MDQFMGAGSMIFDGLCVSPIHLTD